MSNDVVLRLIDAVNSLDVIDDAGNNGVKVQLLELINETFVADGDALHLDLGTGADGRTVEMRNNAGVIEWRYTGETAWKTLIDLSNVTGDDEIFVDASTLHDFPVVGQATKIYHAADSGSIYRWMDTENVGHYVMIGWPCPDVIESKIN